MANPTTTTKLKSSRAAFRISIRRRIAFGLRRLFSSFGYRLVSIASFLTSLRCSQKHNFRINTQHTLHANRFIFYVVGVAWLCLLPYPHPMLQHQVETDEKALLVGQVNRYFGLDDVETAMMSPGGLVSQIWFSNISACERAAILSNAIEDLGLDTSIQRFSYMPLNSSSASSENNLNQNTGLLSRLLGDSGSSAASVRMDHGCNVYGAMRPPRSEGTESIVLVAPLELLNGQDNINGVRVALGLARFLKRSSYWSKDIIVLFTTHGHYGVHAWLEAYHGYRSSAPHFIQYDMLPIHAGKLQSALSLEFPGIGDYTSIGMYPQGINGLLPNADLIATVVQSAMHEDAPIALHDKAPLSGIRNPFDPAIKYKQHVDQLQKFVERQCMSVPDTTHALFLKYTVEAITLRGLDWPNHPRIVNVYRISRVLETIMRSLNNLLEKLHHAFWFYYMTDSVKIIPISVYMAPMAVMMACLAVASLGWWWETGTVQIKEPSASSNAATSDKKTHATSTDDANQLYISRPDGTNSFTDCVRPIYVPIATLVMCFCVCIGFMMWIDPILTLISNGNRDMCISVMSIVLILQVVTVCILVPVFQRWISGSVDVLKSESVWVSKSWRVLKLMTCGAFGMVGVILCAVNPSVGVVLAVPYAPILFMMRPSKVKHLRLLQVLVLTVLSPPGLAAGMMIVRGNAVGVVRIVREALRDWHVFGSWLMPLMGMLIWPLNLAAQVVVEMDP